MHKLPSFVLRSRYRRCQRQARRLSYCMDTAWFRQGDSVGLGGETKTKEIASQPSMTKHQVRLRLAAGCALAGFCAAVSPASAEDAPATKAVKLPFTVFDEKDSTNNHHVPSGWMANTICGSQRHCIRPWYSAITRRKWYNYASSETPGHGFNCGRRNASVSLAGSTFSPPTLAPQPSASESWNAPPG